MRNGVLVGLVETVPESLDLTVDEIVRIIAGTDYDAPLAKRPSRPRPAAATPPPASPGVRGLLRRITGR